MLLCLPLNFSKKSSETFQQIIESVGVGGRMRRKVHIRVLLPTSFRMIFHSNFSYIFIIAINMPLVHMVQSCLVISLLSLYAARAARRPTRGEEFYRNSSSLLRVLDKCTWIFGTACRERLLIGIRWVHINECTNYCTASGRRDAGAINVDGRWNFMNKAGDYPSRIVNFSSSLP